MIRGLRRRFRVRSALAASGEHPERAQLIVLLAGLVILALLRYLNIRLRRQNLEAAARRRAHERRDQARYHLPLPRNHREVLYRSTNESC